MKIPSLKHGEIALLLCDRKTGHILQKNGIDLYLGGQPEPYIIEESISYAKNTVHKLLLINPDLEILLYDHKGDLIEMIKQ